MIRFVAASIDSANVASMKSTFLLLSEDTTHPRSVRGRGRAAPAREDGARGRGAGVGAREEEEKCGCAGS